MSYFCNCARCGKKIETDSFRERNPCNDSEYFCYDCWDSLLDTMRRVIGKFKEREG